MDACIDPLNPGEVLTCCGFAMLAEHVGEDETGFRIDDGKILFMAPDSALAKLDSLKDMDPVEKDGAVSLGTLHLDWWNDGALNRSMKLWAGQQTAFSVLGNLITAARRQSVTKWIDCTETTTGRLGADPLGSWEAQGNGWSINEHKHFQMACRPYVEFGAFLGLQSFMFQWIRKAGFQYSLWKPAPAALARVALLGGTLHSMGRYQTVKGKSGSNSILTPSIAIGGSHHEA